MQPFQVLPINTGHYNAVIGRLRFSKRDMPPSNILSPTAETNRAVGSGVSKTYFEFRHSVRMNLLSTRASEVIPEIATPM